MKQTRLQFIDNSRALCMLWIVGFWHLSGYLSGNFNIANDITNGVTNGVLAAFTFFSAYFLGGKRVTCKADMIELWKKRLLRIYPLFFLSATSLYMIHLLLKIDYIDGFLQYILTLLGVSVFVGKAPQTIWFVSMLLMFYFITPFLLRGKINFRIVVLCIVAAIFIILDFTIEGFESKVAMLFPFFAVGLISSEWKVLSEKKNYGYLLISVVLFILLSKLDGLYPNVLLKVALSAFCVVIIIEVGKIISSSCLFTKLLSYISYASMVAYLFHRQIFGVFQFIFGEFNVFMAYGIVLPITLLCSYFVQYSYDCIIKKLSRSHA